MYNSPNAVKIGIRTEMFKQLATPPVSRVAPFTLMATSESAEESYLFIGTMPGVKEWIDKIQFGDFKDWEYTIKNKDWSNGILVDRNTINDSKKTLGADLVNQITLGVNAWANFPDKLIKNLLTANGNAFDGTAFFATSRPNIQGANAINNIYSGTGTTLAQLETDLKGAIVRLLSFENKEGEIINELDDLVVYAPAHLMDSFNTLFISEKNAAGTNSNTLRNRVKPIKSLQSTSDNDWYLINIATPLKPFIYQSRKTPEFNMKDDPELKYIKYFATSRMNAGYGNPTAIVKVNN